MAYMMRVLRRPRSEVAAAKPIEAFKKCTGCVTPKFCDSNGQCDVKALQKTKRSKNGKAK